MAISLTGLLIYLLVVVVVLVIVRVILEMIPVDARIKQVVWLVIGILLLIGLLNQLGLVGGPILVR